jgi:ubiquinone/menaquinone biosynthesis C-methylase UbiE
MMKLKEQVMTTQVKDLHYIIDSQGRKIKHKSWLSGIFSGLYDRIMEKSVFPKKFKGSLSEHFEILKNEYRDINQKQTLEIATGSGFSSILLNNDNSYTGIDISSGLLSHAVSKFKKNGFHNFELYVADALDMPFSDGYFDVVICDLSLNFLANLEKFVTELKRVMKEDSIFYCSVPVPERKNPRVIIHGTLYSENELKACFEKYNFIFTPKPYINGALLYFEARLISGK